MKEHNIIMYTMTTCGYCKQMKDYLDQEKIKYEERNYKDFKEEWNTIKSLTHSAIFPTFVVGEYYLVPGRDFNNPEECAAYLQQYATLPSNNRQLEEVRELVKNSIHMVKMLTEKVHLLENRLEKQNKKDQLELIRQQILTQHKDRTKNLSSSDQLKETQERQNQIRDAYVQINKTNV